MATPQEGTPPLRWGALSLAAGALLLTYVIEATDKKWFDTGSVGGTGVTYKADWDALGLSLFFNTVPPLAEAYLGDWRLGVIYIGLTLLIVSWWPRRLWARIAMAVPLSVVGAGLLVGAISEYPASVGLATYDRALTSLGTVVGLLLLLGAVLAASPLRRVRALVTTGLSLVLVAVHLFAVDATRSASELAGVGFTQLFASWNPPLFFGAVAIAGLLFAFAPESARDSRSRAVAPAVGSPQ